jgi:hypothetical protein
MLPRLNARVALPVVVRKAKEGASPDVRTSISHTPFPAQQAPYVCRMVTVWDDKQQTRRNTKQATWRMGPFCLYLSTGPQPGCWNKVLLYPADLRSTLVELSLRCMLVARAPALCGCGPALRLHAVDA